MDQSVRELARLQLGKCEASPDFPLLASIYLLPATIATLSPHRCASEARTQMRADLLQFPVAPARLSPLGVGVDPNETDIIGLIG